MKAASAALLLAVLSGRSASGLPGGEWLVAEHRCVSVGSDLMLDGCVLPDGVNGVIGGGDIVFFTWDGGFHWYNSIVPESPLERDILGLHMVTPDSLWAACDDGYLIRTTDGGETWEKQHPTSSNMFEVFFLDHLRGWTGGNSEGGMNHLMESADGGESWHDASFGSDATVIVAIFFLDGDTGWVGGKDSQNLPCLYHTNDGGSTWTRQTLPPLPYNSAVESVEFFDLQSGWVATNNSQSPGYLLSTNNGGDSWTVNTTLPEQYTRLDPLDSSSLAAVSYNAGGTAWFSSSLDGGLNWSHTPTPLYGYVPALARFDASTVIGGSSSSLWGSPDLGGTWIDLAGREIDFESMSWGGSSRAFSAGDGSIYASPDGDRWSGLMGAPRADFVFFLDGSHGWAVDSENDHSVVWRTSDAASTWVWSDPGIQCGLNGIFFPDCSTGWIYGPEGTLLRSTDSGAGWELQDPGISLDINDAFFTDASNGWLAGGSGSSAFVAHTSDGQTWSLQSLPSSPLMSCIRAVWFTDALNGWTLSDNGLVLGTVNGGQTWEMLSQTPCAGGRDILMAEDLSGWIISTDGTLIYRTYDGGRTWSEEWQVQQGQSAPLQGFAECEDGTYWAFGIEATVLRFEPESTSTGQMTSSMIRRTSLAVLANPATGETACLAVTCSSECASSVSIYDAAGRVVSCTGPLRLGAGINPVQLDISGLGSGVYFAALTPDSDSSAIKLLVLR